MRPPGWCRTPGGHTTSREPYPPPIQQHNRGLHCKTMEIVIQYWMIDNPLAALPQADDFPKEFSVTIATGSFSTAKHVWLDKGIVGIQCALTLTKRNVIVVRGYFAKHEDVESHYRVFATLLSSSLLILDYLHEYTWG